MDRLSKQVGISGGCASRVKGRQKSNNAEEKCQEDMNWELIVMEVKPYKTQRSRQEQEKKRRRRGGNLAGLLPMLRPPSSSSGVTFLK